MRIVEFRRKAGVIFIDMDEVVTIGLDERLSMIVMVLKGNGQSCVSLSNEEFKIEDVVEVWMDKKMTLWNNYLRGSRLCLLHPGGHDA